MPALSPAAQPATIDEAMTALTCARSSLETLAALDALARLAQAEAAHVRARIAKAQGGAA